MAEQTNNRDMTDEPDRQDLEDRVDQLESTISKMLPSRRDTLKLGGAALVGGAAMSGSASAGTQQAGTIGTANDPVDVESEDINNADTINTQNILPKNIGNGYHYAAAFDGADADARLDDALGNTSQGDTIFLENAEYNQDHTISQNVVSLIGGGAHNSGTTIIDATFDFTGVLGFISNVGLDTNDGSAGVKLDFGGQATNIRQAGNRNGFIEVKASRCIITHLKDVDVTLNGGDNVVNSCIGTTVTDNGSGNAIGTIV